MATKGKSFRSTDALRLKDEATRELVFRVVQYLERSPLLSFGFEFIEHTFDKAGTGLVIPHPLGFIPKDVIVTSVTGASAVTFNYHLFSKTTLNVDVPSPCTIRLLVGSFRSE